MSHANDPNAAVSPEAAAKMRRISEPANEQNLDRLESLLRDP